MFGYTNVVVKIFLTTSDGTNTTLYHSEPQKLDDGETSLHLAGRMLDEIGIDHTKFRPHIEKVSFGSDTAEYSVRFSVDSGIPEAFDNFLSNLPSTN